MGKRDRFRKRHALVPVVPQGQHEVRAPRRTRNVFARVYEDHYKPLLLISLALLLFAIIVIVAKIATTGDFVEKGVSLRGGLTATIPTTTTDAEALQAALQASLPTAGIEVRVAEEFGRQTALIIESGSIPPNELIAALNHFEPGLGQSTAIEEIGSALSESFFRQTILAIIVAFVFMAIVVFITFRSTAPSMYVVLAAASDIIFTIAMINVFGIQLGTAGIAALLMLVGYSVDTDILLTTRVLRRTEGSIMERIYGAMKTGVLMTGTAIAVCIVTLLLASSDALRQIMLIILIGLVADLIFTWIQNAGILRWYLERRAKT